MARIRTIKPDFWTDEKIVELDFAARLFFIGSWNMADDNGNLQRSAKKLKMQIFPADAIDCEPIVCSLIAHGLFSEYEVNGEKFLHINGFRKHQVINRPSKTGLPTPDSATSPAPLTDDSLTEGKGREEEGKGMEGNGREKEEAHRHNQGGGVRAAEGDVDRHVAVSVLLRSLGVSPMTGAHPMAMAFANTGASDEQLRAAVEIARERKPAPQPISPNYLQPILAEVLNPPEMRQKKRDAWWLTNESMSAKARELGISDAYRGEEPNAFKARIQQAIEAQGRVAA
jgi:hypothetical protein